MRTALITTAAASAIAIASVAVADTSFGTIVAIEPGDDAVTLMDGSSFIVPDASTTNDVSLLNGFVVGDMVSIDWMREGDDRVATYIASPGVEVVQGRIAEVDLTSNTVTLANGAALSFMATAQDQSPLIGFRPGDIVDISYVQSVTPDLGVSEPLGITIEAASAPAAVGTITEIDTVSNSVTLDDGLEYMVAAREDGQSSLAGLRVGDDVRLNLMELDGGTVATSVTPL